MTPAERLEELVERRALGGRPHWQDIDWLVALVKELEKQLELYREAAGVKP